MGKPYIAGGVLTLADIVLGPIVHRCLDFPIDLPALSNLRAWRDKLKAMPSFQKATKG
jgi:glutathione S-transferase